MKWAGLAIISTWVFLAMTAPWLPLESPDKMTLAEQLQPPSSTHLLGTDQNGADLLSRLIWGAKVSLGVSLAVTVLCGSFGLLLGTLAGYGGPRWDMLIMRACDLIYSFPGFLLAIAIAAFLGPSIGNLIFAMTLGGWAGYARLVRGEILRIKERDFVIAAQALGAPTNRIVTIHLWPNLAASFAVQIAFGLAGTILTESSLSFLGLGAPPSTPTWGSLLFAGRAHLFEAPHLSLFPGLAIASLVLAFNFLGDALRDRLDPRNQI